MYGIFIGSVDILFCSGNGYLHLVLVLARGDHSKIRADFVVAFRTPRDIMDICKLEESKGWEISSHNCEVDVLRTA